MKIKTKTKLTTIVFITDYKKKLENLCESSFCLCAHFKKWDSTQIVYIHTSAMYAMSEWCDVYLCLCLREKKNLCSCCNFDLLQILYHRSTAKHMHMCIYTWIRKVLARTVFSEHDKSQDSLSAFIMIDMWLEL